MAQCFKSNSRYQELSEYLLSQGFKQEYIDDYLTRKGIVTNGEYCSEQQALSEITKLTGGKSMREAADESQKQNYLDHKIGNPVEVIYGNGTEYDDITGQAIREISKEISAEMQEIKKRAITDGTFSKENDDIRYQKKPIRKSVFTGRELYSSELALIAPSSNVELHSKNRRDIVRQEMTEISSQYGVDFTNTPESEVWEMDRWRCNDGRFIDFIHFYSQSGVFHGTPAKWENFKKLYTKDGSVDAQYMEEQFDAEMNVRADFYNAIAPKYNAPSDLMSIFADLRKMETAELTNEQRDILNSIDKEYRIERTMYPTLSYIVYGNITTSIDDLKSPNETKEVAVAFISQLSENLGVEYEIIDEQTAKDLLASKGINYNPSVHTAFFVNGKAYFIEGRIDSTTAMHEFSHPILRAIRNENSVLFNNMFESLKNTSAWSSIQEKLRVDYPELSENDDLYKEEALVYAMEFAHENKFQNDNFFKKCIDKIIYAIKQYLRNHLGQSIKISELSVDTTIGDLASMLENNVKFDIKIKNLTESDVVAFKKQEIDLADEISRFYSKGNPLFDRNLNEFNRSINMFADALDAHFDYLKNNNELDRLKELQTNLFGTGELDQMIDEIKSVNNEKQFVSLSDIDIFRKRSLAFANSIAQITSLASQIKTEVERISKGEISKKETQEIYTYYNLVHYWLHDFIEPFKKELKEASKNNSFQPTILENIIAETERLLGSAENTINNIFVDVATDVVYDELTPMYDNFQKQFDERIEALKNAPQDVRDIEFKKFYGMTEKEYQKYKPLLEMAASGTLSTENRITLDKLMQKAHKGLLKTKQEIKEMILGNMGDANFLNSHLEGYMYSTDPIIGGLAMHFKKGFVKAGNDIRNEVNKFHTEVQPLLDKINFSKTKIGSLGKELGFRDKVFDVDEEGNPITKDEWVFLNEFKDYRAEKGRLLYNIKQAELQYNSVHTDENKKLLDEARKALQDFNFNYMNQEYVHEFYEVRNLLQRTEAGQEALNRMDEINELIQEKQHFFDFDSEISEESYNTRRIILDEIDALRRELRQLSNTKDSNGNMKTGKDLEIAKILTEYYDKSAKFYTTITDYDNFDKDFLAFRQQLIDAGYSEGSEKYNKEIDLWLRTNMRYGTTPEFDEARRQALERIIELSSDDTSSEKWKRIFAIINGSKDSDGHVNLSLLSKGQMDEIRILQREIANERTDDPELLEALQDYASLVQKIPSKYYMDSLEYALEDCGLTLGELNKSFGVDNLEEFADFLSSTNIVAEQLKVYQSQSNPNKTLYDWFVDNHYVSAAYTGKGGVTIEKWSRFYFNDVTRPVDKNYEQTYTVVNPETGNIVATISGIPAGRYVRRIVKDEYKTEKIVGKTVDNKNGWLPKSREQMSNVAGLSDNPNDDNYRYKFINTDYERMKDENPDMFAVLEAFKNEHLKVQERTQLKNRLYLSYPRFVKDSAETLGQMSTVGAKETLNQYITRLKQFKDGSPDDYEEGAGDFTVDTATLNSIQDDLSSVPVSGLYNVDADDCSTNIQSTMFRYAESCFREAEARKNASFVKALDVALESNPLKSETYDGTQLKTTGIVEKLIYKGDYVRKDAMKNFKEMNYQGIKTKQFGKKHPFFMRLANFLMGRASFSFFAWNIPSALKNSYGIKFQAALDTVAKEHMNTISLEKGNRWSLDAMTEMAFKGNYDLNSPKSIKRKIIEQFDMKQDKASKIMTDAMWRSVTTDILDGKFFTAPREWLEDQSTYQIGAGILFFKKVNVNGEMVSYMDIIEERDGELTIKDGADIRYNFKNTEYIPKTGDTFESIAKKFNIANPETEGAQYVKRMAGDIEKKINAINDAQKTYDRAVASANRNLTGEERTKALEDARKVYDETIDVNKIVLKNDMYHIIYNEIHQTNNDIGGAYAEFDQPEWSRYFLYRITFFLRRYFIPMFMKRFRINDSISPGHSSNVRGYYITSVMAAWNIMKTKGKYLQFMSTTEKKAFMNTVIEWAMLYSIYAISRLLFGYDPDDEDRYKKLRSKSGALPMPFVEQDNGRKFDLGGYVELHTLHLLLQIRNENEQFVPGFGGIKEMTKVMTDIKSVMFGPTVENLELVCEDIINMTLADDKEGRGYYTRDVGPYAWQKKESPKLYNHMMKWFALTGTTVDPAMAIQNLESQRAKVRR